MKRSKAVVAAVADGVLAGATLAPQAQAMPMKSGMAMKGPSQLDKDFLQAVNEANNAERSYVPVVMKRVSAAGVKQYGNVMIKNRTKANQDLVKLAKSKGVKLPHNVPDKEQAVIDRLAQESGTQFDKSYQAEMIRDHKKDIGDFEREISLGRDASVKAFAVKYLPVIQNHLKMAKAMLPAMSAMKQ